MGDWTEYQAGMAAARSVPDVGAQATMKEIEALGGGSDRGDKSEDWHLGYDYAITLARTGRTND